MKKIDNFTVQRLKEFLTMLTMDYGNSENLWWRTVEHETLGTVVLQCYDLKHDTVISWDRITQQTISLMYKVAKDGEI